MTFLIHRPAVLLLLGMTFSLPSTGCQPAGESPAHALPAPRKEFVIEKGTTEASLVVAGGCFWCVEAVFENVHGVTDVVSGYAGGTAADANYREVSAGRTKHAEVVRVTFNPEIVSHSRILQIFFTMHRPTQADGQHPDIGQQYRSAFFFSNPQEQAFVEAYIHQLNTSGVFIKPVATSVEPLKVFYPAEDYHQDYVKRHPGDPYVKQWALPKVAKAKKLFPEDYHVSP